MLKSKAKMSRTNRINNKGKLRAECRCMWHRKLSNRINRQQRKEYYN